MNGITYTKYLAQSMVHTYDAFVHQMFKIILLYHTYVAS